MKKLFLPLLLCFLFINCENKDSSSGYIDSKRIEYRFYNPKVNTVNNEERKVVFNVDLLESNEMSFLKTGIIKQLTGMDFNKLAGISIYYDNAILNKNVKITKDDIIGLIVYDLDENGLMRNNFFIKNSQNEYERKISLQENMMSTTNQVFLIYNFFPNFYKVKTIGISTLTDVTLNREKIRKQKNEFDLFRVVNTYKNISFGHPLSKDEEDELFRGLPCVNCAEGNWDGICDAGLYCDPDHGGGDDPSLDDGSGDPGMCEDKEKRHQSVVETGILTQSVANSLFNLALHRNLRDNLMINYNIGNKHIAYYYAISGFLQNEDYDLSTLSKMIATLPNFNSSIEKLVDESYNGNDIIITQSLLDDIYLIINDLKDISTNSNYQFILNDLENDLEEIKNKTKTQIINELD